IWFEAKDLPLENYLLSIMKDCDFCVNATANISGELCDGKVNGEVFLRDFTLEDETFFFSLPELTIPLRSKEFSFSRGFLEIPSHEMQIKELKGQLAFSSNKVELIDFEGNSDGIKLLGDASIQSYDHTNERFFV